MKVKLRRRRKTERPKQKVEVRKAGQRKVDIRWMRWKAGKVMKGAGGGGGRKTGIMRVENRGESEERKGESEESKGRAGGYFRKRSEDRAEGVSVGRWRAGEGSRGKEGLCGSKNREEALNSRTEEGQEGRKQEGNVKGSSTTHTQARLGQQHYYQFITRRNIPSLGRYFPPVDHSMGKPATWCEKNCY